MLHVGKGTGLVSWIGISVLAMACSSAGSDDDDAASADAGASGASAVGGTAGATSGTAGTSSSFGGGAGASGTSWGAGGASGSASGAAGSAGASAGNGGGAGAGGSNSGTAGSSGDGGSGGSGGSGGTGGTGAVSACDGLDPSHPTTLFLSADDSNSMASPVLARALIRQGQRPYYNIRTYEFLNYYNVHYDAPAAGELRMVPQVLPGAVDGSFELQIGVQAPPSPAQRPLVNLTFVLDTSGSMEGTGISRERAMLKAVSSALHEGDIVSVITWNTSNSVLLSGHVFQGQNDTSLIGVANALHSDGGTDLSSGLTTGYDLARANFSAGRVNRVVLMSDGGANVGVTDANLIGSQADESNQQEIYLVGVGAGDSYDEALMNTVTDAGNGAYVYLDSDDEAQRMFGDRFDEVFAVAARNVQVSMTIPWYFKLLRFYGEQVSVDPSLVKPQNLSPGDAMIYSQILGACSPDQVVQTDPLSFQAKWTVPGTLQQKTVSVDTTLGELSAAAGQQALRGRAIVRYAEALKTGAALSGQPLETLLNDAKSALDAADPDRVDTDLNEIRDLIDLYPR